MIYASDRNRTERATQQKILHQQLNNHVSQFKKPPQPPQNFVERFFEFSDFFGCGKEEMISWKSNFGSGSFRSKI